MKNERKNIRLRDFDYSKTGYYFVTMCTYNREHLFGEIIEGNMVLNGAGKIVEKSWLDLPNHNTNIELDYYQIMPSHFHFIIKIVGDGSKPSQFDGSKFWAGCEPAPTGNSVKNHGLPEIIRQLKTFSSKKINEMRKIKGIPVWQRNYYEHIIRNENELFRIRNYIINNPINWEYDEENNLKYR